MITTDHSGIPDIFTDAVNGHQVPTRSVEGLRAALAKAAAAPDVLARMAAANLELALRRYRPERYTADLIGIMARVRGEGVA